MPQAIQTTGQDYVEANFHWNRRANSRRGDFGDLVLAGDAEVRKMDSLDQETGEVISLAEAAKDMPQPRYWKRTEGIIEGDPGIEYERAFFEAQKKIAPVVEAESEVSFGTQKRKYANLATLLIKIRPVLAEQGLTLKQGAGRIISHGGFDGPKKQLILPVWTEVKHVETGQWERVYVEIPLVKIDPQAIGSAFTYGRRYLVQSLFGIAATDDDGVLAGYKASLGSDPIGEGADALVEQISACKTVAELTAWYKKNEDGFEILSEDRLDKLREAYKTRLEAIKSTPAEPEKPKKANGKHVEQVNA